SGEVAGHALGDLVLVGLAETLGDLRSALGEAADLLHAVGTVLPATLGPVAITASVGGERIRGQVAVADAGRRARIKDVQLDPADAAASPEAIEAIAHADQIVIAPGSLYTSIVAVLSVPALSGA